MTIGTLFLLSVAVVAAALVILIRTIGVRRTLQHATFIDVIFTVAMVFVFAGTLTGVLIGILAGLIMTGTLTCCKWLVGGVDNIRAERAKKVSGDDWTPPYGWEKL